MTKIAQFEYYFQVININLSLAIALCAGTSLLVKAVGTKHLGIWLVTAIIYQMLMFFSIVKLSLGKINNLLNQKILLILFFVFAISFPCWILDPIPMLILNSYPALMTLNGGCLCGVMSFVITALLVMREWGLKELHFKNNRNVFFIYCNENLKIWQMRTNKNPLMLFLAEII